MAALPPAVRARLGPGEAAGWVTTLSSRIRTAHPALEQTPALFAFLGARLVGPAADKGLEALHVEDLALAWGCLEAVPHALERFDLEVLRPIVRRVGADPDVAQRVREKLWVGRKLEEYGGRGPLAAWTRMVVRRQLLNDVRGPAPVAAGDPAAEPEGDLFALANPELLALREDAKGALKQALAEAMAALPAEDREVLRLHYLDGLPHGEVGKKVGLPRSTVAFRLERARGRLLDHTRAALERALGERRSDVDSLIRAAHSNLELSLSLLRR